MVVIERYKNIKFQNLILVVGLLAVFYNTMLAIVNAHVFSLSYSLVATFEILILLSLRYEFRISNTKNFQFSAFGAFG